MTKKQTEKNLGGRPTKKINYAMLDKYCAIQCTGEECAALLDMDYDTLNINLKRDGHIGFSEYFAIKRCRGTASLRRKQFAQAEAGNPTMLIWLGKQWLNQTDKSESTVTNNQEVQPMTFIFGIAEPVSEMTITRGKKKD